MPADPAAIHPISPTDRALLLAATDPNPPPADLSVDPLDHAHFLSRPDIQPHFEALQAFLQFRAEIERGHLIRQTAELLLEVARQTEDLVEKRRAATAILRLLASPHPARSASEGLSPNARSASEAAPGASARRNSISSSPPRRSDAEPPSHTTDHAHATGLPQPHSQPHSQPEAPPELANPARALSSERSPASRARNADPTHTAAHAPMRTPAAPPPSPTIRPDLIERMRRARIRAPAGAPSHPDTS